MISATKDTNSIERMADAKTRSARRNFVKIARSQVSRTAMSVETATTTTMIRNNVKAKLARSSCVTIVKKTQRNASSAPKIIGTIF